MHKLRVRPPEDTCTEDIPTAVTLATDTRESSQKSFFPSILILFCSEHCICRFGLQTLSIKLQLHNFNSHFHSFLLSSSLRWAFADGWGRWYLAQHAAPREIHKSLPTLYRSFTRIFEVGKGLHHQRKDAYIQLHMENCLNKKPQVQPSQTFWLNTHVRVR